MRRLLLSALFCLCTSIAAQADTFVILPSGEVAFNTSFTTVGSFSCNCTNSGTNSVVFGSGANTLTLTFVGVNTTILVGGQAVPTVMGHINVVASGSGFVFPTQSNPNEPVIFFSLGVLQTSPTVSSGSLLFNTGAGGVTSLLAHTTFTDYVGLSAGPNPFGFTQIVYSFSGFTISNVSGTIDINANVVAVPEPTTLLLLGSGVMLTLLRKRFSDHG